MCIEWKDKLVVGRLSMSAKGFGFIVPEERASEDDTDVFVPSAMLASAMHGDLVKARVFPPFASGRAREGEILQVLERANKRIVGTFESSKDFGFVVPDNTKLKQDILIKKAQFHGAKTGRKVVVEITKWPTQQNAAEGRVIEVLGKAGAPGVDVLSVMRSYELFESFPERVQQEADAIEQEISLQDACGRRDRRDFCVVTVDGEDAKDLDDGVYAERRADGSFFLGVYIADVSWYVRENQPLDLEARERGTSVYLVDRVVPMLPKELSNGICSLNEGVDRFSMACEMELGADGEVLRYEIVPTVIRVRRRLTYHLVNRLLVGREQPFLDDNADLLPMLETLAEIRHARRNLRRARGSIDFEIPEIKVKLDEKGVPVALLKREGSLAESIIEECMLVANETVARHMDLKKLPFLYRVHEQPSNEKMERLNTLLGAFGLFVRPAQDGRVRPMAIQQVLGKVEGKPEERIISTVALRSMQQARYSSQSLGHFGLAARYYTHFTSPIRRYPDLVVHRLLRESLAEGSIPPARQEKLRTLLPEIAEHASMRERVAVEAERETVDMKKIEYMAQFVGEEFDGVISGVTAFGIFVELDNGVEGLVHVSSMANDYYSYVEEQFAMVGERTKERYRLGDEVTVVLVRASIEERNLDFVLKGNGDARAYGIRGERKLGIIAAPPVPEEKEFPKSKSRHGRRKKPAGLEQRIASAFSGERRERKARKKRNRAEKRTGQGMAEWKKGHGKRKTSESIKAGKARKHRPRPHRKTEAATRS